jgi:hypothetical protein
MALIDEPAVARAVLRCLMRDLRRQVQNGLPVPAWAEEVMAGLAAVAEVESPAIGTPVANVVVMSQMVSIAEAAAAVNASEEYVRRLARTGRVLGRRVGARTWLVDLDSLKGVMRHGNQAHAC